MALGQRHDNSLALNLANSASSQVHSPCAAVRDLGKAVTPALKDFVKELGLRIPVLGCHQHFAAYIGEDLLEPSHAKLRKLFKRAGVHVDVRRLARDLGRAIGEEIEEGRPAVREWQSRADDGYGSLDRLDEAFSEVDREDRERRLKGLPPRELTTGNLELQICSASLPTANRRVVRTAEMNRRARAAARSLDPRR